MTQRTEHGTRVAQARTTGALYLAIIVLGLFSELAVRGGVIVPGDAAATAARVVEAETLFRLGFAADIVVFLSDVAVAVLLYVLLRPVSKALSLMAAAFRLTGTAIYGVNLLHQLAALLLLDAGGAYSALGRAQLEALALFFLELHGQGYDLGLVFFGVHCLILGVLLYRSHLFPGVLGILMGLAGGGYLVGSFALFLWPEGADSVAFVYVAPLVGEVAFCVWLLGKGVREERGSARTPAAP